MSIEIAKVCNTAIFWDVCITLGGGLCVKALMGGGAWRYNIGLFAYL